MQGYLIHHGIKGQKWGVRRYQNKEETIIESKKIKLTKGQKIAIGVLGIYGTMSVVAAVNYLKPLYEINKNHNGVPLKIAKSLYNPFFFIKELTK